MVLIRYSLKLVHNNYDHCCVITNTFTSCKTVHLFLLLHQSRTVIQMLVFGNSKNLQQQDKDTEYDRLSGRRV